MLANQLERIARSYAFLHFVAVCGVAGDVTFPEELTSTCDDTLVLLTEKDSRRNRVLLLEDRKTGCNAVGRGPKFQKTDDGTEREGSWIKRNGETEYTTTNVFDIELDIVVYLQKEQDPIGGPILSASL
ncbi:hypothetical protein HZH66_014580 [Vespula vulgaris]|uniref:Uncharacterized protein n=2 Tax=Vespula TaxID=7451 RepID=A0A834MPN3_VESVU|nr:hypothetical protein HZH66_014580 [Vespula vulgaris]